MPHFYGPTELLLVNSDKDVNHATLPPGVHFLDLSEKIAVRQIEEGFTEWCAENDISLEEISFGTTGSRFEVTPASKDAAFALKMRWL
jgi:hypothetical protein